MVAKEEWRLTKQTGTEEDSTCYLILKWQKWGASQNCLDRPLGALTGYNAAVGLIYCKVARWVSMEQNVAVLCKLHSSVSVLSAFCNHCSPVQWNGRH